VFKKKKTGLNRKVEDFRWIIRSLLKTVSTLHERKIAHRDIKPENVVIFEKEAKTGKNESDNESQSDKEEMETLEEKEEEKEREEEAEEEEEAEAKEEEEEEEVYKSEEESESENGHSIVKMIDFGNAMHVDNSSNASEYYELVGTLYYMSPERLDNHLPWHEWSGDVWSVGVITYELPTHVSSDAEWCLLEHFIRHTLVINPKHRPTASYALNHPWLAVSSNLVLLTREDALRQIALWEQAI
ncbi:hypothetical protein RFI_18038, partial [Reticulomyxa filosa]